MTYEPESAVYFGDIVREVMQRQGYTQQRLADDMGVSQPRVSEILASENLTEAVFDAAIGAMGCSYTVKVVAV